MNALARLAYRPGSLDRIAWFLAGLRLPARAIRLPRLEDLCYHMQVKALSLRSTATAREFAPLLERAAALPASAWEFLNTAPDGRSVLVDNAHLKMVLIRWEPGTASARHFHPNGGGMIRVLEGAIQESRFLNDTIAVPYDVRRLERHAMSYIDDRLGAHVVANPGAQPAVTLHAYLKDRRTQKERSTLLAERGAG